MASATRSAPGRRFGKAWVVALVVALAVAVVAILLIGRPSEGRIKHGSLEGPLQGGIPTTSGGPVDLGEPFTYGVLVLENYSERPVVLEEIRLVPAPDGGLELVDVLVAGPERKFASIGADRQFPPADVRDIVRPFEGAAVMPKDTSEGRLGVEVLIGLRMNRPGVRILREIHVDYRIGDREYTGRYEHELVVCAPRSGWPEGCPAEGEPRN